MAGGVGKRSGANQPKQFVKLGGKPMFYYSLKAFHDADANTSIVVVVHPDYIDFFNRYLKGHETDFNYGLKCVPGGNCRAESVMNALQEIAKEPDIEDAVVAIHDSARPLVEQDMIRRGFASAKVGVGGVPAVRCVNSLRRLTGNHTTAVYVDGLESDPVNRSDYVEVQTPQVFCFNDIYEAYCKVDNFFRFTDDASIASNDGLKIKLFEGSDENIKVTNPIDFDIAKLILKSRK